MEKIEKIKVEDIYQAYIYQEFFLDLITRRQAYVDYLKALGGPDLKAYFFRLREEMQASLIEYLIGKNQYIYIGQDFRKDLEKIYNKYILGLLKQLIDEEGQGLEEFLDDFNQELLDYLNGFEEIRKLKSLEGPIANFQYSGAKQVELLGLEDLEEPILDLGCGQDFLLVKHLRSRGLEAFGLDRYSFSQDYLFQGSWLDFSYEKSSYGSIIAHMSFSNHFVRENLKLDGLYQAYAQTYMEILQALRPGGSFYYSPSLDFIEELLDREKYQLSYGQIQGGYKSVKITKITE